MKPSPEVIVACAVKFKNKVYIGVSHELALMSAIIMTGEKNIVGTQGFVLAAGNFVDRKEALEIAQRTGQLKPGSPIAPPNLYKQDLW